MALTPETLPRHELNGLPVRVVDAADPGHVGIEGRVVLETTSTLHVDGTRASGSSSESNSDGERRVRQVPKRGTTFEFALTDETADGERPSSEDARKGSGTASEPGSTAAGTPDAGAGNDPATAGEDVAHVTVDGARLVSRPAERTERNGDSTWR